MHNRTLLFRKRLDKLPPKTYFRLAVYVGNRITANRPEGLGFCSETESPYVALAGLELALNQAG